MSTAVTPQTARKRTFISANSKRPFLDVAELWHYRAVLLALVRREIQVRYAQTIAGATWVILQPILTTAVLTLLAGRWIGVPADGLPYPLFAFSGLVVWIYFTHVLNKSCLCMVSTGLLNKAYFPRLLLPLAASIGALLDVAAAGSVLALVMFHYRVAPRLPLLLFPAAVLLLAIMAFGVAVWLAVLNLYYRDVSHALPFATQLLFFLTPVAYSTSLVPPQWRLVYSLNPVTGVLEAWRFTLFGNPQGFSMAEFGVSVLSGTIVLLTGLWFFRLKEPTLADVGES